jgi:beta-1,4-mannooligosaccharide/beta-1,4-mannosyl-N-acetylglucosamine phosphorylase
LLSPEKIYERVGDVPNVIFPCAALDDDDKIVIYYGAADTVVAIAFGYISGIIAFLRNNSL